ncbi:MAG: diguanylate cyclase [Betaproteobacteria bacterium]
MKRTAFPLEIKLLAAFAIAALGLLVAVALAARAGGAYLDADRASDGLRDLDRAMTALYLSVRTAESGERGYLLTGRDTALVPYMIATGEVAARFEAARALAETNPQTAMALASLRPHVDGLLAGLATAIDLRKREGFDAALRATLAGNGAAEMMTIRIAWETVHADLAAQADALQLRLRAHFDDTMRLLVAGVALALALLAIVYATIAREVRARRRLADRVRREADHDELTRLPNRRFFSQWLGYAMAQARRESSTLGLLCVDIDGFKTINDSAGHEAGDAALVEIARRFSAVKRDSDVLARLGGDEFVLAATGAIDGRELAQLAHRMIDALADPPISSPPIGASIGIAFFPDDAGDPPGLLATADAAMYAAKRAGKNRVVFHAVAEIAHRDAQPQGAG